MICQCYKDVAPKFDFLKWNITRDCKAGSVSIQVCVCVLYTPSTHVCVCVCVYKYVRVCEPNSLWSKL